LANELKYDAAIIGGGLAGLSLSIQLVRKGYKVILLEKEEYPFRRVCGEYISNESRNFLTELGVDLPSLGVTSINRLQVSSVKGKLLQQKLPLGGFGISRYLLDATLASIAVRDGVVLMEHSPVDRVEFINDEFILHTPQHIIRSKIACGCFGKRSSLDIKWKRPFANAHKNKLNNYVGVKYHVKTDFPDDMIALHNFRNGYCGISKIEAGEYCLCYLTAAANLKASGNNFDVMEKTILSENPHLKNIFSKIEKTWKTPVTISQISYDKKTQVEDHVLMIGDAAGMITPLCGNGMSMAMHASKIAAQQVISFFENKITRKEMEANYIRQWKKHFAGRLRMGRIIQRMFNDRTLNNVLISTGKLFPFITRMMIRKTHGDPF
jgi:flavin-dependent dehydrogenase